MDYHIKYKYVRIYKIVFTLVLVLIQNIPTCNCLLLVIIQWNIATGVNFLNNELLRAEFCSLGTIMRVDHFGNYFG